MPAKSGVDCRKRAPPTHIVDLIASSARKISVLYLQRNHAYYYFLDEVVQHQVEAVATRKFAPDRLPVGKLTRSISSRGPMRPVKSDGAPWRPTLHMRAFLAALETS